VTSRTGPRPNLFIIGAAKSGTTSLHHYLNAHPEVFMSEPKEPGFFVEEMDYYPKDEAWYLGLFAAAGNAKVIGESSTHYTKLPIYPGVPERIAAFSPDARFIYLMRDPIERAISHYWHAVRQDAEHRPMLRAIQKDVQYTAFSDYRMQLEPYVDLFGRDRIFLMTFEELTADPRRAVQEVFRWLGVAPHDGPPAFERKNARPPEIERPRGRGLIHRFRFTPFWDRVSPYVPQGLKDRAKRLAVEPVKPSDEPVDAVVAYLRPMMQEKVRELSAYLGREFPEWTTVRATAAAADPAGVAV